MNIMLVTRQFPPRIGGVATASLRMAMSLKRKNHDVTVVACNKMDQSPAFMAEATYRNYQGIPVYDLPEPLVKRDGYAFALSYLNDLALKVNPDIIHSYYIHPMSYIGHYLSGKFGIPHVASCRGDDITLSSLEKTGTVSLILQKVDQLTSVSKSLLSWVELISGRNNGFFVPNSIEETFLVTNLSSRKSVLSRYEIANESIVFAANAVFRWKKGPEYLKELIFHISQSPLANVSFLFIGDYSNYLELDLKKYFLGGSNKGFIRRFIPIRKPSRKELAELLLAVDVFLLTSKREGMPNVALEALFSGAAVAATKVDGNIDLLSESQDLGVLLDRFSPADAAKSIIEYVDKKGDFRENRKNWIKEFYNSDVELHRYEQVYTKALQSCT